ncbi:MAG: hypothetical protein ACREV7_21280 [Steroidobacteraceae bacterium]
MAIGRDSARSLSYSRELWHVSSLALVLGQLGLSEQVVCRNTGQ